MLMHNSGRYVRLCVRPTILILFKVYMYCFLDFFCFKFSKVLKQIMFYGANGLWSGATSISDGIFYNVSCFGNIAAFILSKGMAIYNYYIIVFVIICCTTTPL